MYSISDKRSSVKMLQRYLNKIYEKEMTINKNGVFDEDTLLALNKFQKDNNLDIKEYADYETFSALYSSYIQKQKKLEAQKKNPNVQFPIQRGETSLFVARINHIMSEILIYYSLYWISPKGDYFSNITEEAIRIIRGIFGFEDSDTIDELLYLRLIDEFESINLIKSNEGHYFS